MQNSKKSKIGATWRAEAWFSRWYFQPRRKGGVTCWWRCGFVLCRVRRDNFTAVLGYVPYMWKCVPRIMCWSRSSS